MLYAIQIIFLIVIVNANACAAVQNAAKANPSDVSQAEKFLADLPPACSASYASVADDGTVNIRIICNGSGKSTNGSISIKNGLVTQAQ